MKERPLKNKWIVFSAILAGIGTHILAALIGLGIFFICIFHAIFNNNSKFLLWGKRYFQLYDSITNKDLEN